MLQTGKAEGLAGRLGRAVAIAMLFVALGGVGKAAQASPLDLTIQAAPDMMSDFIDVTYDAAGQTLTARGFAVQVRNGAAEPAPILNGAFEITANIASSGKVTSGTLTITGEVPSMGITQGTLLTGNIRELGFGETGGPMEFQFDTNGGSLAFNFGPLLNVILSQSGFAGNFDRDFSSNSIAVAGIGW
jgi:hypothetical protein